MTFQRDLLREYDRDLADCSRAVFEAYERSVRTSRFVPFATGALRSGIKLARGSTIRAGVATRDLLSTTVSPDGYDYPALLDVKGRHAGWWTRANSERAWQETTDIMRRCNL